MPERAWKDEFTLLCEKCGYVIEGLDTSGNCPECGKAIAESLPERRVGTAWQQQEKLGSLPRTVFLVMRHPLESLDLMRFGTGDYTLATALMVIASFGSALICASSAIAVTGLNHAAKAPQPVEAVMFWLLIAFYAGFGCMLALMLLTRIEASGLVFFSTRRGSRVTEPIARSITAHGCVGWVIAGLGGATAFSASGFAAGVFDLPRLSLALFFTGVSLMFAGFLFFETFAWLGLRRCKFANRARPSTTIEP